MSDLKHFTSVVFHHYKGFEHFSLALRNFNILVGPNNCGKSTIIGAFRILNEAMRVARSRIPTIVTGPDGRNYGYRVDLSKIPMATENIFYNYEDETPAKITFRLSDGNTLDLFFPSQGECNLFCETTGKPVRNTTRFKTEFNVSIGFVPILGPVEHNEQLYQEEAARQALLTHRAARNFRNIWHHFPRGFEKFKELIRSTWPGMEIEKPIIDSSHKKNLLRMFCLEERITREIYWAGFGFQVWCQMLTFIIRHQNSSIFLIDEPDIYLHSDLQRQLLAVLRTLGPDILIATHSTEIITEAETDELLMVDKNLRSAKRLTHPRNLENLFRYLGSNVNPTLTQLVKTRRVLFVEGGDYKILSKFASVLGLSSAANRNNFVLVPLEGHKPQKVKDMMEAINITAGTNISFAVVFDRDYKNDIECEEIINLLEGDCSFVHIHSRKEIENYLIHSAALSRATKKRINDHNSRSDDSVEFNDDIKSTLSYVSDKMRQRIMARYINKHNKFLKSTKPRWSNQSRNEESIRQFERIWDSPEERLRILPGKDYMSKVKEQIQSKYRISLSNELIIRSFKRGEVDEDLRSLLRIIDAFGAHSN